METSAGPREYVLRTSKMQGLLRKGQEIGVNGDLRTIGIKEEGLIEAVQKPARWFRWVVVNGVNDVMRVFRYTERRSKTTARHEEAEGKTPECRQR